MYKFGILGKLPYDFVGDRRGHFAVTTALLGLPLLIGLGAAIDMGNSIRIKSAISAAADSAALAAVLAGEMSDIERENYAKMAFDKNFTGFDYVQRQIAVKVRTGIVDIMVEAQSPSLLGGMVNQDKVNIKFNAMAAITHSETVCVLALDPSGEKSIMFLDDVKFSAPSCSVQANSSHSNALYAQTMSSPVAKSFCSVGGGMGRLTPPLNSLCTAIEDPYKDWVVPEPKRECDSRRQVVVRGSNGVGQAQSFIESDLPANSDGETIIPSFATLSPGKFCRGLVVSGANVEFEPGVYHIWGDLEFTHNAAVKGDGVTFILLGRRSRLLVEDGAEVSFKAPVTGETAGLVFWQNYRNMGGRVKMPPKKAIATSEIRSGGGLNIIGTAYFPNHELIFDSNNNIASQSPAMSLIAFRVKFAGKTNMNVQVDHVAAGLPPLQPRSDEGAKLVK